MHGSDQWKELVWNAIEGLADEAGLDRGQIGPNMLIPETPPKPELGDLAFPMFPFAKQFKRSPQSIAESVAARVADRSPGGAVEVSGPYVNIRFDRGEYTAETLRAALRAGEEYGTGSSMAGRKIMVEFSCPNTNKPLHLGHLRNDAIGESVSRILKAAGAEVRKVNLINDRGIHICKSMAAYERFGNGSTPESEGVKSDHFVGNYYVAFSKWAESDPAADEQAREMLRKWEQSDERTMELWQQMNRWAIEGIEESYAHTGISFDDVYYESRTYLLGKQEVLKGLEAGVFYKDEQGTVWVDLSDVDLDEKVLLRSDGTSLYLTQDIGTAIQRQRDWPFDQLVYVVASEQQYHFRVLFHVLEKLGYEWARSLYHLSYGMVNLPEGKMKSREGTVVDADDLLKQLEDMAEGEIREKERESEVEDVQETAKRVALAALHYYLLQASPHRDMVFDPQESLSFNGNTGPYLQYMVARISSMLRRLGSEPLPAADEVDVSLLGTEEEWELVKLIAEYPARVAEAASEMNPSLVATYLYELAKSFSKYYHEHPIVTAEDRELRRARTALAVSVRQVLKSGFALTAIPFLETM
jgi:arginyl-tRNA synthetase